MVNETQNIEQFKQALKANTPLKRFQITHNS